MKKLLLFTTIALSVKLLPAQSEADIKKQQLQKLKEQSDSIRTAVNNLEKEISTATSSVSGHNSVSYLSERPMQQITARLIDKRTGAPVSGIRSYLSVPGNNFELRTGLSDSTGMVHFLLQHVYPGKPMIFQTDRRTDSMYRFEVPDPFQGKKFSRENPNDSLAFFGKPDKRYMLDDYTRFPTMEEVLIEYVPEIKLRKLRGHYYLQALNIPYKTFFEQQPIVLIDGVPVFSLDAFMAIDPLKIKKLEVIARKYYYGSVAWDGIVSFSSYDGDLAGYSLYDNAIVKEFRK